MQQVIESIFSRLRGDKVIWLTILGLVVFSVLAVYSSTWSLGVRETGNFAYFAIKHLFVIILGIGIVFFAHLLDYKYYSRVAQVFLILSVPLLIYTLFFGKEINDARRWVELPIVRLTFQSSDFAKLALIMYTARELSKKQSEIKKFKEAFLPITIPVVIVCVLIAIADLSTAVMLFATCIVILFIGRINLKYIFGMIGIGIASLSLMIAVLSITPDRGRLDTWIQRIEDFTTDKDGSYQIQQAKIAIAEGGVVGKGPGNSDQRNYLPHPYSDFIYALIIEEYGLLGGFAIVALYLLLLYRCIRIVIKSPRAFGALLAVGLGFSLVVQALVHMAVNVHLFPVTGLTLPMVSMGGSSIWFIGLALGMILSASRGADEYIEQRKMEYATT